MSINLNKVIRKRRNDILIQYLEEGGNPDFQYSTGDGRDRTLPILALRCQNYRALRILLKYGANPNAHDSKGKSLLGYMLKDYSPLPLGYLLEAGHHVDPVQFWGKIEQKGSRSGSVEELKGLKSTVLVPYFEEAVQNGKLGAFIWPKLAIYCRDPEFFDKAPSDMEKSDLNIIMAAAIRSGWKEGFDYLLSRGVEVSEANIDLAIMRNNSYVLGKIIESGILETAEDDVKNRLLAKAVIKQNKLLVEYLLGHGAIISKEYFDNSVMNYIWKKCGIDSEIFNLLHPHGLLYAASRKHKEQLAKSALYGDNDALLKGIITSGMKFDSNSRISGTPLAFLALHFNAASCLEVLLESGVDPDANNPDGKSLLSLAVTGRKLKCLDTLISHGADVNMADREGEFPIHKAIGQRIECLKLIQALVDAGADLNRQDKLGNTPLHLALAYGFTQLADFLKSQGARDDIPNYFGIAAKDFGKGIKAGYQAPDPGLWTESILKAVEKEQVNEVRKFLNLGCPMVFQGKNGMVSLLSHCKEGRNGILIARMLLEAGADPDAKDDIAGTPLSAALLSDNSLLFDLLCQEGANIETIDKEVFINACEYGNYSTIEIMLEKGIPYSDEILARGLVTYLEGYFDDDEKNDFVNLLTKHGLPFNAVVDGEHLFVHIVEHCDPRTVAMALNQGVDPTVCGEQGRDAVEKAIWRDEYPEILEMLADRGCNLEGWSKDESFVVTAIRNNFDWIDLFVRNGVDLNADGLDTIGDLLLESYYLDKLDELIRNEKLDLSYKNHHGQTLYEAIMEERDKCQGKKGFKNEFTILDNIIEDFSSDMHECNSPG